MGLLAENRAVEKNKKTATNISRRKNYKVETSRDQNVQKLLSKLEVDLNLELPIRLVA